MINFQNIFCIILLIAFLIILAIYGPRFKIKPVVSEEFSSKCGLREIDINQANKPNINDDNDGVRFVGEKYKIPSFVTKSHSYIAQKPVKSCWNRFKNDYTVNNGNLIFADEDMQNDGTMITQQTSDKSNGQSTKPRIKVRLPGDNNQFKVTSGDIQSAEDKHIFNTTSQPWYSFYRHHGLEIPNSSDIGSRWNYGQIQTPAVYLNHEDVKFSISEIDKELEFSTPSDKGFYLFCSKDFNNFVGFTQGPQPEDNNLCIGDACLTQTDIENIQERILSKNYDATHNNTNRKKQKVIVTNSIKTVGNSSIPIDNWNQSERSGGSVYINQTTTTPDTRTTNIEFKNNNWNITNENNQVQIKQGRANKLLLGSNNNNIFMGDGQICKNCTGNNFSESGEQDRTCNTNECIGNVEGDSYKWNSWWNGAANHINIINTATGSGTDDQRYLAYNGGKPTFKNINSGGSRYDSKQQWVLRPY